MTDLRIVDAPTMPQNTIVDDVKLPTGGLGNFSIRLGDIVWYVVTKGQLADKNYVDLSSKGVKNSLDTHIADKANPHQVNKWQVGLGNVDNTADVDKPVSHAVSSAIISATNEFTTRAYVYGALSTTTMDMATKTYVNQQDNLKADKETTYTKIEVDTRILNNAVKSLSLDNTDTLSLKLADNTTKTVSLTSVFTNNIEKGIDDSNVKVKQPFLGSVERSQQDKNSDTISLKDFGAKGDGVTDDTVAIQNWLNALSSKVSGFIPSGNYIFKKTLYKPDTTVITGCGSSSMLTYAGTATHIDLLDFGVSSKNTDKWVLQNFLVTSDTKMTSGYAMRFRRFSDTFIDKVIVEGMDLHKFNLYHGYFFDGCHEVWLSHFQAFCQGNGISVCGWNEQSNCDLYLSNGYANFCKNGIVVGGGFGGLFLGNNIELLGNSKTNMTIDQSLNNQSNREVLIDSIGCFDGIWGTPVGLLIDCPDSTAMQILIEGYICSNTEKLIYIKSAPNSHVSIKSSKLYNSKNHGVVIDDPTTKVVIGNGTTISNNVGWAVFATAETKLVYSEAVMYDNGGKYSHNVKNQDWQTYAVNYSATSGKFNYLHVYGRYKIVGGVCHFTVEVVCDDVGTASGAFFIQLPVPPRNFVVAVGRDNGNTGKVVIGNCPNYTGDMMLITTFDNYFPVYNGSRLQLAGSYEYDRFLK